MFQGLPGPAGPFGPKGAMGLGYQGEKGPEVIGFGTLIFCLIFIYCNICGDSVVQVVNS